MKKQIIIALLMTAGCASSMHAMFYTEQNITKMKQLIENGEYGKKMIFKFAPNENQLNYEAFVDTQTMVTYIKFKDHNDQYNFFITNHHPFISETFFKNMHRITEDTWKRKFLEVEDTFENTESKPRFIHINNLTSPDKIYESIMFFVKKTNREYYYGEGDDAHHNGIARIGCNFTTNKQQFDDAAQRYQLQKNNLAQLHKNWVTAQFCKNFGINKLSNTSCDITINYETDASKDTKSLQKWIENKQLAKEKEELEEKEMNIALDDALDVYESIKKN